MKTIRYTIMILTILTTLALVACGQVESTATPEPTATPCPQPSDIVQLVTDQIVDTLEARTDNPFEVKITFSDGLSEVMNSDGVYTYTGDFEAEGTAFHKSVSQGHIRLQGLLTEP